MMSLKLVILMLFAGLLGINCDEKVPRYRFSAQATDETIESDDYPSSYRRDVNITWEWKVKSGGWGIVFEDFDLDSGKEKDDDYDYLEIVDGCCKTMRYAYDNRPPTYKTKGPHLIIRFVTDGHTEHSSRGFRLLVVYGKDERDLDIKLYEASKKDREDDHEESSPLLIIIAASLIVLIVVIVIGVFLLWLRRKHDRQNENRNAFGVRRGSGISHSRRERPAVNGGTPFDNQPQQQQAVQQLHQQQSVERPVQRSDSTLTWMARAELTTTIQTAGRTPTKNIYTPTSVTRETPVKTITESSNEYQDSLERQAASTSNGAVRSRTATVQNSGNNSTVRNDSRRAESQRPQNLITSVSNGSVPVSPSASTGTSEPFSSPVASHSVSTIPASPHVSSGATIGGAAGVVEYSDTLDSLNVKTGSRDSALDYDDSQDIKPPSYDESHLSPLPPPYLAKSGNAKSAGCYENVTFINNSSCAGSRCIGSQTNIYINAGALPLGSNGSLNRVTIDTSSSATMTHSNSHEDDAMARMDKDPARRSGSSKDNQATKQNEADIRLSRSPTSGKRTHSATKSSGSKVQIVDGYAYIVPTSNPDQTEERKRPGSSEKSLQWSVGNQTSIHLDIVPSKEKVLPSDADDGYTDLVREQQGVTDSKTVYVNVNND